MEDGEHPDAPSKRLGTRLWAACAFVVAAVAVLVIGDAYHWAKNLFADEPALDITLVTDPSSWEAGRDKPHEPFEYVFTRPLAQVTKPPSGTCYLRHRWAKALGGVDARRTEFKVVLQSDTEKPVMLQRIVLVIRARRRSLNGIHVACPVGGATANVRKVSVDLDRSTAVFEDGEGNPLPTRLLKFNRGETEVLAVVARAEHADYEWRLRFDLLVDGKSEVAFLPGHRESFSTTGIGNARTVHWLDGRWVRGQGPPVAGLLSP
jgi:hypothetical protein